MTTDRDPPGPDAEAAVPPPPPPSSDGPGRDVRVPRWAFVTATVVVGLVVAGALFGVGYATRGSSSSSSSAEKTCSTDAVLKAAEEWTAATRRFYGAKENTSEYEAALDASATEDEHLQATFMKCFPEAK